MSKDFLKRLIEAHSWLGLMVSGLLFIVFFAGSISLFRDDVKQWALQPHLPISEVVSADKALLPIHSVIEIAKEGLNVKKNGRIRVFQPTHTQPYYLVSIDLVRKPNEPRRASFLIDPYTGEKLKSPQGFQLSQFLYRLHIDLNIPAGEYVVGFVTLFFFFALVSGIFIHARKLVGNFFKYRSKSQPRSKLLDMHNVVGVMSLPFTIMYAISGLIFNLVIIYQIAFAVFLYQGDQAALLNDAGVQQVNEQWQDKPLAMHSIDDLLSQAIKKYESMPNSVVIYNYGDESAVVRFIITPPNTLTEVREITYYIKDASIHSQFNAEHSNTLREGLRVFAKLHFADFAGFDLRILYFILGVGVCALIVTGNLLWIEQREKKRNQSAKTLAFIKSYTMWSTGGVMLATAVAFLVERVLPFEPSSRAEYMEYSFIVSLLLVAIVLCFKLNKKYVLAWLLRLSGYITLLTVLCDWVMFSDEIITLWSQGVTSIIGTEIGLVFVAILLIVVSKRLLLKPVQTSDLTLKDATL